MPKMIGTINLLKKADIPASVKNRTADSPEPRKKSRNNSVKGRRNGRNAYFF